MKSVKKILGDELLHTIVPFSCHAISEKVRGKLGIFIWLSVWAQINKQVRESTEY